MDYGIINVQLHCHYYSYKQNVLALSTIVKDQPTSTLEKAVWWVEYCIRHKGMTHLHYHGTNVPLYQYFYLDVMVIYACLLLLLILTIRFIKRWFVKRLKDLVKTVKLKIN